jgi:hypothetical protein
MPSSQLAEKRSIFLSVDIETLRHYREPPDPRDVFSPPSLLIIVSLAGSLSGFTWRERP